MRTTDCMTQTYEPQCTCAPVYNTLRRVHTVLGRRRRKSSYRNRKWSRCVLSRCLSRVLSSLVRRGQRELNVMLLPTWSLDGIQQTCARFQSRAIWTRNDRSKTCLSTRSAIAGAYFQSITVLLSALDRWTLI